MNSRPVARDMPAVGQGLHGGWQEQPDQGHPLPRHQRGGAPAQGRRRGPQAGVGHAPLREVSDTWLADKHTRENRFSLGFFSEEYLRQFPAAVARQSGDIIAFANIWAGAEKEELSIDLMRYLPRAAHGLMDYLPANIMLWGRQQGYGWFNLGMAPLSRLENHPLRPVWNRVGGIIFRHGEHFHNFQGLREYKEKSDPVWTPKYMACPSGFAVPRVLTNLAVLISGGPIGLIAK
jgi:phosphatidylglycerol lysyltransferase